MGSLTLPAAGLVCLDANAFIYTVEKHPVYGPLLHPLWTAAKAGQLEVACSDLLLMEVLIGPLKSGNRQLETDYEAALRTGIRLLPITQPILRLAAQLRATTKLRTPDALHAATALHVQCALFVTNDMGMRAVPQLPVVVLDDLLKP